MDRVDHNTTAESGCPSPVVGASDFVGLLVSGGVGDPQVAAAFPVSVMKDDHGSAGRVVRSHFQLESLAGHFSPCYSGIAWKLDNFFQ